MPFAIDGPREYHAKRSKPQTLDDMTYIWNIKNNTNEYIQKTDSQTSINKLKIFKGERWGRGGQIRSLGLIYRNYYI